MHAQSIKKICFAGMVVLIGFAALFPFYWAFVSSLKTGTALFDTQMFPQAISLSNYHDIATDTMFARSLANSFYVASGVVALSLGLATMAAYALGRYHFRGRRLLLLGILGVSTFPQVAVLSGLFELIRWLGLYNNLHGLMITYLIFTLPFTIWVLTSFMRELPREIEEAAIMDGASSWTILVRIFLPLLKPALLTTGLLAFIAAWNEFLFALTFTLTQNKRTIPVAIAMINGASQHELPWGKIMAASVIVTLPLVFLVFVFQRRIVAGLTSGAVKG
ncbi:MAG: carbohydrate ABC transporter permease [Alphaproteobacteria bacterium]